MLKPELELELIGALAIDPHYRTVLKALHSRTADKPNDGTKEETYQGFQMRKNGLLYLLDETDETGRLCVPSSKLDTFLKEAHDGQAHQGARKTYDRLRRDIYAANLRRTVEKYVRSCPQCQLSKPSRHKPFGQLQPIPSSSIPFETLSLDFVVKLPISTTGYNCILTVTDKFTRAVKLIAGHGTGSAKDWARLFFERVVCSWGLPRALVSDRDPKFTSLFWKALFETMSTKLCLTAAYHPAANGQAENTNQTMEIALRCLLVGSYETQWEERLPEVEYAMNTAVHDTTGVTPFLLMYGIEHRTPVGGPSSLTTVDEFAACQEQIRKDVSDTLAMAKARMAFYFDQNHKPIKLSGMVYLKLAKGIKSGYRLPHSTTLTTIRTGPYRIKRQRGPFTYELDLPKEVKIHPVISAIHLEQAQEDQWGRPRPSKSQPVVDQQERFAIESIQDKQRRGNRDFYLVKYEDFDNPEWQKASTIKREAPGVVQEWEARQRIEQTRPKRRQ
jgi:hypothetical protein